MKLGLFCLTMTLATLIGASSSRADELKLKKDGEVVTVDCTGKTIVLGGSRSTVTLTGTCAEVDVKGSENTIRVDSATKFEIWGSKNSIDVVATGEFQLAGDDNRVNYVRALGKKKTPAIKQWGKRNVVKRVTKLAGTTGGDAAKPAPTETQPKNAKPDALRPHKPIVCERNEQVTLDGVLIETTGTAVTTGASCTLSITNSKIVSTGSFAITPGGSSRVTFENVEVSGKFASISTGGSADVTVKSSTLKGPLMIGGSATLKLSTSHVHGGRSVTKSATFVDSGGNTFHKK
jgi:hypothetical protein